MTNSPYVSGSADPHRTPPPAGPPPQGAQSAGPAPMSFQYRPHDPRASYAAGRPAESVLPPPPTFAQRWGFVGTADRPRQITVSLQALWINLGVTVLALVIALAAAGGPLALVAGVVFGVLAAAANLALIWAYARERLGRFGLQNPRHPVFIGLGLISLNALIGFLSGWTFVPALAQLVAALLVLVLLVTRPARAWLRDRNQPRKEEERRPLPGENYAAGPPPQASWAASPVAPPNQPSNGWPQPPR